MSHGSSVSIVTRLRENRVPSVAEVRVLPASGPVLRSKEPSIQWVQGGL